MQQHLYAAFPKLASSKRSFPSLGVLYVQYLLHVAPAILIIPYTNLHTYIIGYYNPSVRITA